MLLEFVGQSSYDSDNITGDPSRLINCYREKAGDGTPWLKSVLGMSAHTELPGVFVASMGVADDKLYAVCGGVFYRILPDGSFSNLGDVGAGNGNIAGNNGKVTVHSGSRYFVWNGNSLTEFTDGAFSKYGSLEFFSNYTILTELNGRKFQWSDLANPEKFPGLNFSTADGRDDHIVRAYALHGQLFIFKQQSYETWYNTGQAGAYVFSRTAGGIKDVGLKGHNLICRFAGGAFMIGSDNRAHIVGPGGLQPVSTPAVETAIKTQSPESCITYADEGHEFLCIIFRDAPAWCYDLATGEWHERAEGANLTPWRASSSVKFNGEWYTGSNDGRISVLRRTDSDDVFPLVREATSRTLYLDGNRSIVRELEFFARNGFANATASIRVSRDGGITWTPEKHKPFGQVGQYERRIIYRNLGIARRFNVKLRWSKPGNINVSAQCRVAI